MSQDKSVAQKLGGWIALLAVGSSIYYVSDVMNSGELVSEIELAAPGKTDAGPIRLEPAMDPVRARLEVDFRGRGHIGDYKVEISNADSDPVFVKFGSSDNSNAGNSGSGDVVQNLGTFKVPTAGEYSINTELSNVASVGGAKFLLNAKSKRWNFFVISFIVVAFIVGFILGRPRKEKGQQ